ncbi:MAG: hypothetical protein VB142_02955 [Burkholderia sp.]
MAKYGQAFKEKVVARLLPPKSALVEDVAQETRVNVGTLHRDWTPCSPLLRWTRHRATHGTARTACIRRSLLPGGTQPPPQALADPQDVRATPGQTTMDRRQIKKLEREVRCKDRALAETTALLVLSKKLEAIFHKGEDE